MRVGWMSAPKEIVDRIARLAEDTYITPGMLPQGVVHEFLERGMLPAAIDRLKALYAPRLKAILSALDEHVSGASWIRPEGGFFLGLTLPEGVRSADARRLLYVEQISFSNLHLVEVAGGTVPPESRHLTTGTASRQSPRISPDGSLVAFVERGHAGANVYHHNTRH